ncbi:hypothetical protein C8F01DRAFT_500495 [Mycena amicta]|nr:hypothetical protein C8F01DRAFT_500495 [Mycena amicta]
MSTTLDEEQIGGLWVLVQSQAVAAAAALFMHGIFVLLFIIALNYLFRPPQGTPQIHGHTILRMTAVLLAIFAVSQVAIDVTLVALVSNALNKRVLLGTTPKGLMASYNSMYKARQVTLAVNNFVADGLFLYRCKLIWRGHRYERLVIGIVLFFIAATATVAGISIAFVLNIRIPFGAALVTNVILLGLTAGRIWAKGRRAAPLMGSNMHARWRTAMSILAESSLIYVAANALYMLSMTKDVPPFPAFQNICWGALAQVVNIVPMMMLARVALSKNIENESDAAPLRVESDRSTSEFSIKPKELV